MCAFLKKIICKKSNNNKNTYLFGMKYFDLGINQMEL